MKKGLLFTLLALALCLISFAAFASGDTAQALQSVAAAQVPAGAVLLSYELDDGAFDFKFWSNDTQEMYEVTVDPAAGKAIKKESDRFDDRGGASVKLTQDEAKQAVLAEYPDAVIQSVVVAQDDGLYEYKVAFTSGTISGLYAIHPESGVILERELYLESAAQVIPSSGGTAADTGSGTAAGSAAASGAAQSVTAQQAQALVLARLNGGKIIEFKTDKDDGRTVFEGEARDDTYEYDFEIDAATGRFLQWESERYAAQTAQKTAKPAQQTETSSSLIGTSKAKSIAVKKAGGGSVSSIRLTKDDGRQVYEGKVRTSTYEYEFEIDAATGSVLDWDADRIEQDDDDDDRYDRDDDDDDDDDD